LKTKRKSTRAKDAAIALIEACGYSCTPVTSGFGLFDVVAFGPAGCGHQGENRQQRRDRGRARTTKRLLSTANITKEVWRFPDECRAPLIQRPVKA